MNITPTAQAHVMAQIDVGALGNGMHAFNYRTVDSRGYYSSIVSQLFYKAGLNNGISNDIVAYEYWFDDDDQNKTVVNITPTAQAHVMAQIDVGTLGNGMHAFNYRTVDSRGYYSSTVSQLFYKTGLNNGISNDIVAYEYWFDDDDQNKTVVNITPTAQAHVMAQIDVGALGNGMHAFNYRALDEQGYYSSTVSQLFYKKPGDVTVAREVVSYKYWFNNDHMNAVHVKLQAPADNLHLVDIVDMTKIQKGLHTIHFQFKDVAGYWSVVTSDTIEKISLPVADFFYTASGVTCDSTIVDFTDLSIDGDIYDWDFGDGMSDTVVNPTHTYYTPGAFAVSLTVTDTVTLADSTRKATLMITGNTDTSFMASSCNSYTTPSENYTFNNSGIYKDTISNQWGCDSIMTIDVTILNSSSSTDVITACDAYTWIDGNTYTTNNNVATDTLINTAGCDSVVTLDLTINKTPGNSVSQNGTILTADATNVNYQWLDCDSNCVLLAGETHQSFTATANGNYAVVVSNNGCVDTSACFFVTITNILENNLGCDFELYPNPTDRKINIDLGEAHNEIILNIFDYKGQLMRELFYNDQQKVTIDFIEPPGIYFIVIYSKMNKSIFKVIKH